ncbi:hypothetical protein [Streptomyces sp. NPDC049555]|uniref:hypothetical protein n=1 Tax=Streptomyces sp. NPDC049555 TaxID=3154930 RepID=UPI0034416008
MPGTAIAPYAQAAAVVDPNGNVVRSHGVVSVTRVEAGVYDIVVDAGIDLENAVPIAVGATGTVFGFALVQALDIVGQTFRVVTFAPHRPGAYTDLAFCAIVP